MGVGGWAAGRRGYWGGGQGGGAVSKGQRESARGTLGIQHTRE
jgi:hypothetical protein